MTSSAARALRCNDVLQHLLQWCHLPELVAIECVQRDLRHDLLDAASERMARLWPTHLVHVPVSDDSKWDRMQASATGRAVRHLDFTELPLFEQFRPWMNNWTFPLVSLRLPATKHFIFNQSISRYALAECLWHSCCGDTEIPTMAELQALKQFLNPHAEEVLASRTTFVNSTEHEVKEYHWIYFLETHLPLNVLLRIEHQWPVVQTFADWLTAPACQSLVAISCDLGSCYDVRCWPCIVMSLLRYHSPRIQHLEIRNATSFALSLVPMLSLTRLSLVYTNKHDAWMETFSNPALLQAITECHLVINIRNKHIDIADSPPPSGLDGLYTGLVRGTIIWPLESIAHGPWGAETANCLCRALQGAPTPVRPTKLVNFDLGPGLD
jgi:hypothetical protein